MRRVWMGSYVMAGGSHCCVRSAPFSVSGHSSDHARFGAPPSLFSCYRQPPPKGKRPGKRVPPTKVWLPSCFVDLGEPPPPFLPPPVTRFCRAALLS